MLTILFKIFSILGMILLILLGIALLLILLVLFFPVFYKTIGKRNSGEQQFSVKANWLFGLLRLSYDYPVPGKLVIKLLFLTIYDSTVEKSPRAREEKITAAEKTTTTAGDGAADSGEKDAVAAEFSELAARDNEQEQHEPTDDPTERSHTFFDKIRYTVQKIYDKIKHILQNISFYKGLWDDPDTQELLRHACHRIGCILKSLRPRRLQVNAIFGTGSPDTTGYLYGIYGMLLPKIGKGICITPDFEQVILEGNFKAFGHFTVAWIAFHAARLFFDQRLRILQDRIRQFKKTQKK